MFCIALKRSIVGTTTSFYLFIYLFLLLVQSEIVLVVLITNKAQFLLQKT